MDGRWQEIVEVSFQPVGDVSLVGWAGEWSQSLEIPPVGYRVRYSADGMDEGHALDTRMDGDPAADRCLLQLWPAPSQPDRVIKQTSQIAAYWHQTTQQ